MWGLINYNFDSINSENNNGDEDITNGIASHITFKSYVIPGSIAVSAGIMSAITGPIIKMTLQNVTMPQMRGQAFALLNTFDDFGRGLGPAFVAWMIEKMGGRKSAFNIGILGWVLCGWLNLMLYFTVERDEEKVRKGVAEIREIESRDQDEDNKICDSSEFR
jgi:hypothetical protein